MLQSTIRAVRSLLDAQRVLAVAVQAHGAPLAGLLPFAPMPDRSGVLVHVSGLARHAAGLADGARVGVLLHEADAPEKDPLQLQRVTFDCRAHALARGEEAWHAGRSLYVERFPGGAVTFELGDFTLLRLDFESGLYVAGFGRAIALPRDDIARLADGG